MSLESVKKYFKDNNLPLKVSETDKITDTVANAAKAFGIEEDEIAKTMGFQPEKRGMYSYSYKRNSKNR